MTSFLTVTRRLLTAIGSDAMRDPFAITIALWGLGFLGAFVLGRNAAAAVRDSDWFLIARGLTAGKCRRLRRSLRQLRRG